MYFNFCTSNYLFKVLKAIEVVSYPVILVFKTRNRVLLILLFTARKSLLKNLVISSNSSCSLSGQEFRQSLSVWVLCFRVSYKAASRVPPGTTVVCVLVHLRQDILFGSLLGCLVVYIPSLMGCWTQGLSSLLAVGWRPPSVPCHTGPCRIAAYFIKLDKPRQQ